MIRDVQFKDSEDICDIYNHYIRNTSISFEKEEVSKGIILDRIEETSENFFQIVYEEGESVLGYAYISPFKSRAAYKNTVECSIYIKHTEGGKGIGSKLFSELIKRCKSMNFRTIIGVITLPNEKSIALHEKFGFEKVAHFKEVGFKFGRWVDVSSWQLLL